MNYQVYWIDHRGAGCMRAFSDEDALVRFIKRLRQIAIIYDESSRVVGGIKRDYHRWLWWFESDVQRRA